MKLDSLNFKFLDIVDLYKNNEYLKSVHLQELRLAALLHDIGHGPLSHKFDSFTITKEKFMAIIDSNTLLSKYYKNFEKLLEKKGANEKIEHEDISCLFILELVAKLKVEKDNMPNKFFAPLGKMIDEISGERIVRLIQNKLDFGQKGKVIVNNIDLTFLYSSVISSFPIDADRMDYLLRDGTFTGVKYGVYDLARIYTSLVPIKVKNKGYLAVKESGVDACVRFIESRAHLFNIVYPHKTNISASAMLDFIFDDFKNSIIEVNNYEELVNFYWLNSDEHFVRNTIKNEVINKVNDKKIKIDKENTLEELLRRRMWKKLYTLRFAINTKTKKLNKDYINTKVKIDTIKKDINRKLKANNFNAKCDIFINNIFKDSEKSNLFILKKDNTKGYNLIKDWVGFNEDIDAINYKVCFVKIFMARDFNSSIEFIEKQKEIMGLIDENINSLENLKNSK